MKTIVWDVDDVLNNLTSAWYVDKFRRYPEQEVIEHDSSSPFGMDLEEFRESIDNFKYNNFAKLHPNYDVMQWFNHNGHKYRHMALTASPLHSSDLSASWVMGWFGDWIRSFHVVPSPRKFYTEAYPDTKASYLKRLGIGDYFIDDNDKNVREVVDQCGIHSILFPQPWNKNNHSISQTLGLIR